MAKNELILLIKTKFERLEPYLNEKTIRFWAATEALALERGGVSLVAQATGLSRTTIHGAIQEMKQKPTTTEARTGRIRQSGGGRKRLTEQDQTLVQDLESLVDPVTRGDPDCPLRWTCKSTNRLAEELRRRGHQVSQRTVYTLLRELDYSLQANCKTKEGTTHLDRNAQFEHIARQVKKFQAQGQPVISVDAKKKELVGEFFNKGHEWRPKGDPRQVNIYDFVDPNFGKVIPYGIYDLSANQGWVSVGIDHDTAEFAVASIRRWWQEMGSPLYPTATDLLITADGGGSNGSRVRLWKVALQTLAQELSMNLHVCHFPPGTSKWNKIEHRMFCHISENWRGQSLTSRAVVVHLIRQTTTATGLEIRAALDEHLYPTGTKVTDELFNSILIDRDVFHGEWNYIIKPKINNSN